MIRKINLGTIPIIVKDRKTAEKAGEYVEKLVRDILK
jgi:hypothetical protein